MAIAAVNVSYLGNGPTGSGQTTSNNSPGVGGKKLDFMGTATLDGAATTFTINWVDGIQKPFGKLVVLSLTSASTASGGNTVYGTNNAANQIPVGTSVVIAGFSTGANNGTFTVQSATANTITVNNGSGVAETNPAATLTCTIGGTPIAVEVARTGNSFTGVADTAVATTTVLSASSITSTGSTLTISAAGSAAQLLSFIGTVYFAS